MKLCVILVVVACGLAEGRDIPSVFQKCKKTDEHLSKCLTETANKGWPKLVKGDESWGTISLNRFVEEKGTILKGTVENAVFTGLKDIHFKEINIDLKKKLLNVTFTCPSINLSGDIDIEGNILSLRLAEKGTVSATFINGVYTFGFKYELKEKDGQQYAHVKHHAVVYTIERLNAEINGDDNARSARANKFFKDNWKVINTLSVDAINKIFSVAFASHVDKFLEEVPFNTLFE